MKRFTLLLALAATVFSFGSLSAAQTPKWLDDACIYHIYPSTFMDSDGDGIGDLNGIRSRLDYIKSVGFNCIWLSPCFASDWKDGGYDITDFYAIDKRFGTNDDLFALVKEAHDKGIKVLLDLVAGHTSIKHPWFQASAKAERNEYSDYYIWTNGKPAKKPGKKFVDNKSLERDGYYIKNFFDIQPALNYGYYRPNPDHEWEQGYDAAGPTAVRKELMRIIDFWCSRGVDGFRVDMAASLVKGDDKDHSGVRRLWKEVFAWYNEKYPENIMLSEWSIPRQSLDAGFSIDLLIHNGVGGKIYRPLVCSTTDKMAPTDCYFDKAGKGDIRKPMEIYADTYKASREMGGYASMPTCSHDIWRLRRMNRDTAEEQKVVLTMFLTLPAPPIVYYGEEIGMRNLEYAPPKEGSFSSRNRSTCRTPMQWDATANAGFSSVKNAEKLYLPVDNTPDAPNVAAEEKDVNSILNYVKGLIALRKATPALGAKAEWEYVGDLDNPYPMIYKRSLGGKNYIVVLNPSNRIATGSTARLGKKAVWVYGNDARLAKCKTSSDNHTFTMQPVSAAIYEIE